MTVAKRHIIAGIVSVLKKRYSGESSGHDWLHLERVWKTAIRLSENEKVDMFVVEVAALLHDVDDYKFAKAGDGPLTHTKEILGVYPIDTRTKKHIYTIVSHVSFKGGNEDDVQKTREGQVVQDADRLDVLGAIGIARIFAYGGSRGHPIYDPNIKPRKNMTFKEYRKDSPSINHMYEKLLLLKDRMNTPQAKLIASFRHTYIVEFLREFWAEVKGDR